MILEKINSPQDIKKLGIKDLKILCKEIRDYIIEVVSETGGHLASNLGVVELSVALHYVLNTPHDKIIFDTGHQCYTHKILTGRFRDFKNLRRLEGISGFPAPSESEYDVFYTGHASNAVSLGLGLVCARDLENKDFKVVCVVGDGALSGGQTFEGLNNAGELKKDLLIILNSNEMSISKCVGAISVYLNRIITSPIYNRLKSEVSKFIESFPKFGKRMTNLIKKFEEGLKNILVPGIIFEELGFRYFGPIDGHNLKILISTLKNVLKIKGPKVLHVVTKKGKGYVFSEQNPEKFHSSPPFIIQTGDSKKPKTESFTDVFSKKIVELAKKDKKIVAITAAMKKGTGLDKFEAEFKDRFFDVGICEEHAVSFSAGLAKLGFKPFVCIYSTFLQRAYDQIMQDVCLQNLKVVFILDRAGLVGEDGPTHHGNFDIAYLRTIPRLIITAPKDKEELEDFLEFSLNVNGPISIRFPKDESFSLNKRTPIKLGKAEILKEGKDIALLCVGVMCKYVFEILEELKSKGISPLVVNMRFINPLDEDLLLKIAKEFKLIITLEEGILDGGFGSAVLEFYEKKDLLEKINIKRIGLKKDFITFGKRDELLELNGLKAKPLLNQILKFLKETIYV